MLPLDIDPKLAWALKFRDRFPVDVNRAPREMLLRVPGLGVKAVGRILASRRWRRLRLDDVGAADCVDRQGAAVHRSPPTGGRHAARRPSARSAHAGGPKREQLELFAA